MEISKSLNEPFSRPHRLPSLLSWLILLAGLSIILLSAYMVVVSYSALPFEEGWMQISAPASGMNPMAIDWLWRQHLEHRMPIPKVFLAADLRFFHARQVFLLASIFGAQLLHWGMLGWAMHALGGWRGALWRTGLGVAAFCLFFPSQWENFVWGFELNFVLAALFASLSFIALLVYWKREGDPRHPTAWYWLGASILSAITASLSLANGNALWPFLLAAALLLRFRWRAIASLLAAAIFWIALYFHHYVRPPDSSDPLLLLRKPGQTLQYVATYLGASWTTRYSHNAIYFGAAGLLLAVCLLPRLRLRVTVSSAFSVLLVLTLLFTLATAVLTAGGRIGSGHSQVFASRYQIFALLFWFALVLLWIFPLFQSTTKKSAAILVEVLLLGVMIGSSHVAFDAVRQARFHGFELRLAAAGLMTGVSDIPQFEHVYTRPEYLAPLADYMRVKRLSIFADPGSQLMNQPLSALNSESQGDCAGAVQSVETLGGGEMKISGWAWDRQTKRSPGSVIAVAHGVIVGLGATGDWRPAIRAANRYLGTSYVGFTTYTRELKPGSEISLFAVPPGDVGPACYFAKVTAGIR